MGCCGDFLPRLVAGDDGFVVSLQKHHADGDRHAPEERADQVDIGSHLVETPAEAEAALDEAGLDVGR